MSDPNHIGAADGRPVCTVYVCVGCRELWRKTARRRRRSDDISLSLWIDGRCSSWQYWPVYIFCWRLIMWI